MSTIEPIERYAGNAPALTAAALPEGADAIVVVKAVRLRCGRAVFVARDDARASAFRQGRAGSGRRTSRF